MQCKWSVYVLWPYGVQGIFYFIPPYSVNGWCIIFSPMVYRAFYFSNSAIRCIWSVYNLWPYGVQGIFYFIPPYGVNGRCIIYGPMVYRAFFILFRHTVLMVGV